MTTVPMWEHIIVVLALLGSNTATFLIFKHRVEGLQAALLAKRVLLGGVVTAVSGNYVIEKDETLSMRDGNGGRMDIVARHQRAQLEITVA